ncbi:MAG TPA: glycosyltransferase [Vicinamibacterales bacterium]|nr:glycosyltransferase [Vicinamibacterales bacterium]
MVLPAYNEEGNLTPLIGAIVDRASEDRLSVRVIVVDDGSTDGTARELEALQSRVPALCVVRHDGNRGLARALKTGMAAACADGCDAAVFMDSDLSHRPEDLSKLVAAIERGADVALGSRFVADGGMDGVPAWRRLISRAGNSFGRRLLGVPFRDLTTGYRAVRRSVIETIVLGEDGFTIQLESVIKAAAAGFSVVEVPIVLGTRRHGESHMRYDAALFRNYWRLLMSCRRWMREARA